MKNRINIAIVCVLMAALFFACKKQEVPADNKGVVVFKIGDAWVEREGKTKVDINSQDIVLKNDLIITGPDSSLSIQVGDNFIVRVLADSFVKMTSLSKEEGAVFLEKGEVLSKVERLKKDNSFQVRSRTALAAVRGTEFGISIDGEKTLIAVNSGKVTVKPVSDADGSKKGDEKADESTVVEKGFVGVVEKKPQAAKYSVIIRPISKKESLVVSKVSAIDFSAKPESISEKELNKLVQRIIKADARINEELKNLPDDRTAAKGAVKTKKEEIQVLIRKKNRSIADIKEVFDRIDKISLYNGRTIQGAIMTRGEEYKVLTVNGVVRVKKKDIRDTKVIR
ncbi:MAG: FecR domain-containing protein [bacterium]|nr:FecR domain-containing protein [bacterium]